MKKKEEKKESFLDRIALDFKKNLFVSIILNSLFLVFGIYIYLNPVLAEEVTGIIIGLFLIVFGIFDAFEFLTRGNNSLFTLKIFVAILAIILGVFVIVNPFSIVKILSFTLGIYLIILSIFKGVLSFILKKYKFDGWLLVLVVSLILLVFGIFITINPMSSIYIVEAVALFIILSSILELCSLLMLYSKANEIIKLLEK